MEQIHTHKFARRWKLLQWVVFILFGRVNTNLYWPIGESDVNQVKVDTDSREVCKRKDGNGRKGTVFLQAIVPNEFQEQKDIFAVSRPYRHDEL